MMPRTKSPLGALWRLFTPDQRRRYIALQLLFVVAGVLQVAGAGSIAPFVSLLSDPTLLERNAMLKSLMSLVGAHGETAGLTAFAVFTLVVVTASNIVAAISVWAIFRFSFGLGAEMQRDLLCAYLHRDYAALTKTNSSDLIALIHQGSTRFTYNVVQPIMVLASQAMIVLAVVVLLAWYRPSALTAFAVLAGGGYGVLFYLVRRKLEFHGLASWESHQKKQRVLTEALGGLKEIRLAGVEQHYQDEFDHQIRKGLRSEALVGLYGDLPRFFIETIAICTLLTFAVLLLRRGTPASEVVAMLSVFAMSGYRLLPAAQSIFKSASQIRANIGVIDDIEFDILDGRRIAALPPEPDVALASFSGSIELRDVWFRYGPDLPDVLRGLTTVVRPGELTVLVGRSGSGKSTLADLLLGLLIPQSGQVSVGGSPIQEVQRAWQRSVGYVPQSIFLLDDSIARNVAFGSVGPVDEARLARALRLAQLSEVVEGLPGRTEFRVGERGALLSGGQRQRVGVARALYHDAHVLILDEATSALDGTTEHELIDTLHELKRESIVVMIAHRAATIQAADRVLLLANGEIEADGSYEQLLETSEAFRTLMIRRSDASIEPIPSPSPEPELAHRGG